MACHGYDLSFGACISLPMDEVPSFEQHKSVQRVILQASARAWEMLQDTGDVVQRRESHSDLSPSAGTENGTDTARSTWAAKGNWSLHMDADGGQFRVESGP